jgi:hypothetical protein
VVVEQETPTTPETVDQVVVVLVKVDQQQVAQEPLAKEITEQTVGKFPDRALVAVAVDPVDHQPRQQPESVAQVAQEHHRRLQVHQSQEVAAVEVLVKLHPEELRPQVVEMAPFYLQEPQQTEQMEPEAAVEVAEALSVKVVEELSFYATRIPLTTSQQLAAV